MSSIPPVGEKYPGSIGEVSLGNGEYRVGGAQGMPFISFDSQNKRRPMIAGEIVDDLTDYPELAAKMFAGRHKDPVEWALMWRSMGVDAICLRLKSLDPDKSGKSPELAAQLVKKILDATGIPIILYGCGIPEIDNKAIPIIAQSVKDSRLILSKAEENDYKTVSAAGLAGGHVVLAFSNLDVNLAKQMNILLTDFGVQSNNIVMDPLMAPLGMGLDYSYSVNERIRLAALMGDKMLQVPVICDATGSWDVSDAVSEDDPRLGDASHRVTWWETMTAMAAIVSGADIVIIRGPGAADMIRGYTDELRDE